MPVTTRGRRLPVGFWKGASKMGRTRKPKAVARANRRVATVGVVKKLIAKHNETKLVGLNQNEVYFNQQISATTDLLPLLPLLGQGTDDNTRIGNKVNPKGMYVTVTLSINSDQVGPGEVLLPRIFVLSARDVKDMASLIASGGSQTYLLDGGYGQHAFAGTQGDYRCPINKHEFIVHKDIKTKLCANAAEMDTAYTKTFRFWIKCPKSLTYNDSQNYPRNFAPFMYISYARGDNQVLPITTTQLRASWTSTFYYEDA